MHFSLIALFTALAGAATANPAPSTSSACDVQSCEDRLSADVDKCQLNFGIPTRYGNFYNANCVKDAVDSAPSKHPQCTTCGNKMLINITVS